ncbi:hypothetical protein PILCRDRAFT_758204 [Piloderma croceum F 1598]|uniref:Uncharacterized protein n=1 Tax=Piloderma croceum (strain F 1598) TaxID=765440 RepID=A0A0C3ABW1_PILCF|nr:hypothetical protein PILCRDRAFT_758204 [Piloderma croceum F 1598]
MENLYAYYAQVYQQEQEELRTASDNSVSQEQDDSALLAEPAALNEFYKSNRLSIKYQLECDDAVSRIRYSHLQTLLPLQKKLVTLSARFPESIDAYHALNNNKDMQLRVAKFLSAPSNMRDGMLSEFRWAWRQVKPLLDDFERDNGGTKIRKRE